MVAALIALCLTGLVPARSSGASAPRAINLAASPGVKVALITTFEIDRHVPPSAITGFVPGALWYAYDEITKTYWAVGSMDLSDHVSERVAIEMQDGGSNLIFRRLRGHHWTLDWTIGEPYCDGFTHSNVPSAVRILWGICGT